jgi:hypothetical protein
LIRQFRRKFSISTPRLAVRPHVPWYIRWAIILPMVVALGGIVWWAYDVGLEFAGFHRGQAEHELGQLRAELNNLRKETTRLSSQAATFERQAQIEHAANLETARQLKVVTEEKTRIQEDLAFFQSLSLMGAHKGELSIHRLKLERDALPGEYRYRLLLVHSGQKRPYEFSGKIQLLVNTLHSGKKAVLLFPQEGTSAEGKAYELNFKYYQRIERSFRLPPDTVLESMQVRIFERGISEPRIQQSVALS